MNEGVISAVDIPPFLFHYIIVIVCVTYIVCVCVLKFKYLYWYSQPLTFRFTIRRFGGGGGGGGGHRPRSTIMNPLSLGERCYNAVVYPFLNNVNHNSVQVYSDADANVIDAPFERIAAFLSRRETEIMMPGRREIKMDSYMCIPEDTLRIILSQDTFGLSVFIGVINDPLRGADVIKGVSILTPRIMLTFESSTTSVPYQSVSIYMSEYLAWNRYTVGDRESLELLETTEYIQKSREIAGEQTLYRYRELPWFVIPFSTVYSYMFSIPEAPPSIILGDGMSVVAVSSVNFALFYSFVNECSRDFRCCIFNELTQLQSLVDRGLYRIYMLLLNQVRVVAVYLFAPSWMKTMKPQSSIMSKTRTKKRMTTKGNRISDLHKYISNTSTALVKYIPPVIIPRYDAFGKRITTTTTTTTSTIAATDESILLLMSSIQHKTLCDKTDFVSGFQLAARMLSSIHTKKEDICIIIDTLAHNYRLIDDITASVSNARAWKLLSQDKWYYILYNAIIHEQTLCKDILLV
jgi:hypothetical protein